jgi:hypothetical protein
VPAALVVIIQIFIQPLLSHVPSQRIDTAIMHQSRVNNGLDNCWVKVFGMRFRTRGPSRNVAVAVQLVFLDSLHPAHDGRVGVAKMAGHSPGGSNPALHATQLAFALVPDGDLRYMAWQQFKHNLGAKLLNHYAPLTKYDKAFNVAIRSHPAASSSNPEGVPLKTHQVNPELVAEIQSEVEAMLAKLTQDGGSPLDPYAILRGVRDLARGRTAAERTGARGELNVSASTLRRDVSAAMDNQELISEITRASGGTHELTREALTAAWRTLSNEERYVLRGWFGLSPDGRTSLTDMARFLGRSKTFVHDLRFNAINSLQQGLWPTHEFPRLEQRVQHILLRAGVKTQLELRARINDLLLPGELVPADFRNLEVWLIEHQLRPLTPLLDRRRLAYVGIRPA